METISALARRTRPEGATFRKRAGAAGVVGMLAGAVLAGAPVLVAARR